MENYSHQQKDVPTWLYDALKSALDETDWVDGLSTLEEKLGIAFYEDEEFDWNLETLLKMINKKRINSSLFFLRLLF